MGLRDDAIGVWVAWRQVAADEAPDDPEWESTARRVREALGVRPEFNLELQSPFDAEVDVRPDWHTYGFVANIEGDDLEMFVKVDFDEVGNPTTNLYPVGVCRRCELKVPLGPDSAFELSAVGRSLAVGTPVGHPCPGPPI